MSVPPQLKIRYVVAEVGAGDGDRLTVVEDAGVLRHDLRVPEGGPAGGEVRFCRDVVGRGLDFAKEIIIPNENMINRNNTSVRMAKERES